MLCRSLLAHNRLFGPQATCWPQATSWPPNHFLAPNPLFGLKPPFGPQTTFRPPNHFSARNPPLQIVTPASRPRASLSLTPVTLTTNTRPTPHSPTQPPDFAKAYGFEVGLKTYRWPDGFRAQTEKQVRLDHIFANLWINSFTDF